VLLGRAGRRVVRLKVGATRLSLAAARTSNTCALMASPMRWCPGITAAWGCAACADVPLTRREHAQSVCFVTAQGRQSMAALDWAALPPGRQTLAVYMGVGWLASLTAALLTHGRATDTPFALIENGTRPQQRVLTGALAHLGWYGAPPVTAEPVERVTLDSGGVKAEAKALDCS